MTKEKGTNYIDVNYLDSLSILNNKYFSASLFIVISALYLLLFYLKQYEYATIFFYIDLGLIIFFLTSKLTDSDKMDTIKYTNLYEILFFIIYSISIYFLYGHISSYNRPLYYIILIAICVFFLFLIMQSDSRRIQNCLPFYIVLLALNIFSSNSIFFPYGTYASGDSHYAIYNIVLPIIESGEIPMGYVYSFFPVHHIIAAIISIYTGINGIYIYYIANTIFYSINTLFIFLFGRHFWGIRLGFISTLIYISSSKIIYHATHPYQFSYAHHIAIWILFCALILASRRNNSQNHGSWVFLYIILTISLVWMHYFTSLLVFGCVAILFLQNFLFIKRNDYSKLILIFSAILLLNWIYISEFFTKFVNVLDVYYSAFFSAENYEALAASTASIPLWLEFFDASADGIVFMLATIGTLYYLKHYNPSQLIIIIYALFGFLFIFLGSIIDTPLLQSSRLIAFFSSISIIYLAALGLISLIKKLGKKGILISSIISSALIIFALGSTMSGAETSLFNGEKPYIKFFDTPEDLQSESWIQKNTLEDVQICSSRSWVLAYHDRYRNYNDLPIMNNNQLSTADLNLSDYFILSYYDMAAGLRVQEFTRSDQMNAVKAGNMSSIEAGKLFSRLIKLKNDDYLNADLIYNTLYSNKLINIYAPSPL